MQAPTTNDWKAGFPLTGSRRPSTWTAATLLSHPASLEAATLMPNICVIDSQRRSAATLQLASGFRMTG